VDAPLAAPTDLRTALAAAARLFDAGLFFEVHEVLEPHWATARDATRDALQGLIQIAVGWQHLANGNLGGARSLLADGAARLHGRVLLGLELEAFARAAAAAAERVPEAVPPAFPRLPL
jgi:predicted metal-dependent hydrolase